MRRHTSGGDGVHIRRLSGAYTNSILMLSHVMIQFVLIITVNKISITNRGIVNVPRYLDVCICSYIVDV